MPSHPRSDNALVSDFLSQLVLAPCQRHKSLAIWPLLRRSDAPAARGPRYVPLADAFATNDLSIDEVSQQGSVPHVRVTNQGVDAALLLFGEELRGAKQNRIANASFLVPGNGEVVIDVSCVEHGRWGRRSGARFEAGLGLLSTSLRRKMALKVKAARAAGGRFDADQGEVWEEIAGRVSFSGTRSDTGAYSDYFAHRSGDVEEICGAFRPLEGQVGFVAAVGNEVIGAEVIGCPEVFAAVFVNLLRGYAIDAVDDGFLREHEGPGTVAPRFEAPEPFLQALGQAPADSGPSLGLGRDLRIEGNGVCGCALATEEVVHLTAFPHQAP